MRRATPGRYLPVSHNLNIKGKSGTMGLFLTSMIDVELYGLPQRQLAASSYQVPLDTVIIKVEPNLKQGSLTVALGATMPEV